MLEVLGEIDAVVSGPRLLAESHDPVVLLDIELDEALAKTMAHHAVADDDYRLLVQAAFDTRSSVCVLYKIVY